MLFGGAGEGKEVRFYWRDRRLRVGVGRANVAGEVQGVRSEEKLECCGWEGGGEGEKEFEGGTVGGN